MSFLGFSDDTLDFLADLTIHNDKEWFEANRDRYRDVVLAPAVDFVVAVGEGLQQRIPDIRFDTRTNGSGSLMRIHRDTRFSKDKSPYKTSVSGMWWQGDGKKMNRPGFGFQLEESGLRLMGGMFGFDKPQLAAYRRAVDNVTTGGELQQLVDRVEASPGWEVVGEHYKRIPPGYDAQHSRQRLLRFNSLYAHPTEPVDPEVICSPELLPTVLDVFDQAAPLQQWLVKMLT
ncbi:MAG: DUF2461 domain-containing protein [Acidimicrobiia bacterium]|nr:DUF2461 domain-containing protein [Acidimicrobiia bacterium]